MKDIIDMMNNKLLQTINKLATQEQGSRHLPGSQAFPGPIVTRTREREGSGGLLPRAGAAIGIYIVRSASRST